VFVFAAVTAGAYATGVRRLARHGRSWRIGRTAAATGAVVAISIAGVVPDRTFTGHMVEHVLVGMVAPVLLALAAPLTLALQTSSPTVRSVLRRALRSWPVTALSRPVVGFVLFGTTTVALYLTPLLELTARSNPSHALLHVHLLAVGCLFVWPLVGTDPSPRPIPPGARLLVVLLAVPFHAFLGLALLSASHPAAPDAYPDLADQHRAAGLLWVAGELMTLTVATIVWRAWFETDRREAIRLDRRLSAVVADARSVGP
jgi:putative membrane protein